MPAVLTTLNFAGSRIKGLSKPLTGDEPYRRADVTGEEVDPGGGGGGSTGFTFNITAPASPVAGDRWLDANTGVMYTYVNDGNSSQWVEL